MTGHRVFDNLRQSLGTADRHGRVRGDDIIRRCGGELTLHLRHHRAALYKHACLAVLLGTGCHELNLRARFEVHELVVVKHKTRETFTGNLERITRRKAHVLEGVQSVAVTGNGTITVQLEDLDGAVLVASARENENERNSDRNDRQNASSDD